MDRYCNSKLNFKQQRPQNM